MHITYGKLAVIALYLSFGIYITAIFPYISQKSRSIRKPGAFLRLDWFLILSCAIGIVAFTLIPFSYVAMSLIASIALGWNAKNNQRRIVIALFIGLIASSFLPWWMHNESNRLSLSFIESLSVIIITSLTYLLFNNQKIFDPKFNQIANITLWLIFIVVAIACIFSLDIGLNTHNRIQWHHWGAYIGPAELIREGALPLNDIPLQYGLGPSLLIAAGCSVNCWSALFWISSFSTFFMLLLLALTAIEVYRPHNFIQTTILLCLTFICTIFYTAYPADLFSVMTTPSTTGIRFLPGVLMLYVLIQKTITKTDTPPGTWGILLNSNLLPSIIWVLSIAYSPEAAIQTSVLWAPYYLWNKVWGNKATHIFRQIGSALVKLLGTAAIGIGFFFLIYLLTLGETPNLKTYFVYLLYPPGPLPINQNGGIWFVGVIAILWIGSLASNEEKYFLKKSLQISWLIALLCFANFTYYLGRSHDNNILNLLPYFSLALLIINKNSSNNIAKAMSGIMLASLIGWVAIFGFDRYTTAFKSVDFFKNTPSSIAESFNRRNEKSEVYLESHDPKNNSKNIDARMAINYIEGNFYEAVEVIDRFLVINGGRNYSPWNALHGPENYMAGIPSEYRKKYLSNTANRIKRSGWVLYENDFNPEDLESYLADYDNIYFRSKILHFGSYTAIRFEPRTTGN